MACIITVIILLVCLCSVGIVKVALSEPETTVVFVLQEQCYTSYLNMTRLKELTVEYVKAINKSLEVNMLPESGELNVLFMLNVYN